MKKKEVVVLGTCEVLVLIIAVSMAEKGYITRMNALLLVASWLIFMLIVRNVTEKKHRAPSADREHFRKLYF